MISKGGGGEVTVTILIYVYIHCVFWSPKESPRPPSHFDLTKIVSTVNNLSLGHFRSDVRVVRDETFVSICGLLPRPLHCDETLVSFHVHHGFLVAMKHSFPCEALTYSLAVEHPAPSWYPHALQLAMQHSCLSWLATMRCHLKRSGATSVSFRLEPAFYWRCNIRRFSWHTHDPFCRERAWAVGAFPVRMALSAGARQRPIRQSAMRQRHYTRTSLRIFSAACMVATKDKVRFLALSYCLAT